MSAKRGLRAPFDCQLVSAYVEPTGLIVEQRGERYQRVKVRTRRAEPKYLWVPVWPTRNDIDSMLEEERHGAVSQRSPTVITDLGEVQ
jgi:hypothetical protein